METIAIKAIKGGGGGGGTTDYSALSNKPQIEGVTLAGNKTLENIKANVTLTKDTTPSSGDVATYTLKQGDTEVGKINIPLDYLVKSAELKTCTTDDVPVSGYKVGDKYLDFVINVKSGTATDSHIYINLEEISKATILKYDGTDIKNGTAIMTFASIKKLLDDNKVVRIDDTVTKTIMDYEAYENDCIWFCSSYEIDSVWNLARLTINADNSIIYDVKEIQDKLNVTNQNIAIDTDNKIYTKVDDTTIDNNASHQIEVKDSGITFEKLDPNMVKVMFTSDDGKIYQAKYINAEIETLVAPAYKETTTYNKDSKVTRNGIFYNCLEDNVTGTFDATKWQQITVSDIGGKVYTPGNGIRIDSGSSEIATLNDGDTITNNDEGANTLAESGVETKHIKDANVTEDKLATDSVTTIKIKDSNVTTAKIADENVTEAKLATDSVTTTKIKDANVTTDKVADANITEAKLATDSVTTAKIKDDNVTIDKIADDNISTAIADKDTAVDTKLTTEKAVRTELDKLVVTVEKQATAEEGYISTYIVKQNDTQVGAKINIPKDYLVKSGSVKTCTVDDDPVEGYKVGDKYLDFVVNTKEGSGTDEHIYILVKELVDVYTGSACIDISATNIISVKDASLTQDKTADSFWNDNSFTGTTNAENVVVSGDLTCDGDTSIANGTVSGELDVPTPTADTMVANKKYVDDNVLYDDATIDKNSDNKFEVKDGAISASKMATQTASDKGKTYRIKSDGTWSLQEISDFTDVDEFPTSELDETTIYRKETTNLINKYNLDSTFELLFYTVTPQGLEDSSTGGVITWEEINADQATYESWFVQNDNGEITKYINLTTSDKLYIDTASYTPETDYILKHAKDGVLYTISSGSSSSSVTPDDVTIELNSANMLQVKSGGITTDKLANSSVETNKIIDDAVTIDKINDNDISTDIADDTSAVDTKLTTEKAVRTKLDLKEDIANKVTVIDASASDKKYPSALAVKTELELKENLSNKITTVESTSTNDEYPSGKAVYDLVKPLMGAISTKVVDTLPTPLVNNTMYYVGTASPYQIVLVDSDGVSHDLGTTALDLNEYVKFADVVNSLTDTSTDKPLSANQGKVLDETKENVSNKVLIITSTSTDDEYPSSKAVYSYTNDTFLPLAGGTMTGAIKTTIGTVITGLDTGYYAWYAGTGYRHGSRVVLWGKDCTEYGDPGQFTIDADNGSNIKTLIGKPDGTLTWDGSQLATEAYVDNIIGDINTVLTALTSGSGV